MRIWSISNQKGGVGKTTSVVTLGGLLAAQGKRVLLVDLDPHGSLTSYFRQDPDSLDRSIYHLFFEQRYKDKHYIESVLKPTSLANVSLLPATTSLATLERQVSGQDGMGLVVARTLAQLWDDYDYALIDTPPILGVLLVNALAACQRLVVPTQTEHLAMKGLERMVHTLKMVMRSQNRQLPYLIVPTLFDRRTSASVTTLKEMRRTYVESLWDEAIPVDTRLRDASHEGVFPHQMDPDTRGVRAYRHLLNILDMSEDAHA
ncbi:MAG: ParA family protein [Thalassolituus sp.]|uniref:ParA family protein n=1 Tax=Thalassolituus TaxID=187492 RepID=UPI000348ABD2|nr:ParA family protein [Thalassolituus oleivorans]PCI50868.1 MAG: ParA family protein [Oceanospirillales bacterium]PHQ87488.1 MAG: ParA family protein [Thalassobium sp.]AHK15342.1 cobyric acid synthase [Thalassolituus oleivorans R6-15]APR68758.1 cobalamin biosynthesis protein CobQ [Thalassolituus oleivorans]MBQ0726854.1 ParA family protein [Thalassolituus oleivorans]